MIGKDGRVISAQAMSRSNGLRKVAEFRPFLITGKLTEVETNLPVIFTLGGSKTLWHLRPALHLQGSVTFLLLSQRECGIFLLETQMAGWWWRL